MVALVLLLLFTGCGKDGADKTPSGVTVTTSVSPTVTDTPTPTPTPERAPKEYSLEKLYDNAGDENIFRLMKIEFSDAAQTDRYAACSEVHTAGDYVLMLMRDTWPDDNARPGEYVLFHLGRPDLKRYFTPDYPEMYATVLEDGTVVMLDCESGDVHVYDREFVQVRTFSVPQTEQFSMLAVSEEGLLWYSDEETHCLITYDLEGNRVGSYPHTATGVFNYIGTVSGKKFFRASFGDGQLGTLVLEAEASELTVADMNSDSIGLFGYRNDARLWCLHVLGDPDNEVFFPKAMQGEYIDWWCGTCFATCGTTTEKEFLVYDLSRLVVEGRLGESKLPQYTGLNAKCLSANNGLLIEAETADGTCDLLLWDVNREEAAPIAEVETYTEENLQRCIEQKVTAIRETYAVEIHYDAESMEQSPLVPWYEITPLEDSFSVYCFVYAVAECMKEYPTELWREMRRGVKEGIDMYLNRHMEAPEQDHFTAAGVVDYYNERMAIAFSTDALPSLETTFAHETMHMMEYRIWKYMDDQGLSWMEYWATLNSEKYPYDLEYTASDAYVPGVYLAGFGRAENDPEDVWFVRSYGMWNENEDRATVMEHMYSDTWGMFDDCPHLRDKAKAISAVLRAAFPCVAASEEPVVWERTLGIIDPEEYYEEWSKYHKKVYG